MSITIGRFAPTPSGALHFGSLIAALGSFLSAKAAGGKWLVRIEDSDRARAVCGADLEILRQLEAYNLFWDGEIIYQSARFEIYRSYLEKLREKTYLCFCSRSDLETLNNIHPSSCVKNANRSLGDRGVTRIRVTSETISFCDRIIGDFSQNLAKEVGDFVVWNRDDEPSYHLASTIDDALCGVTEIVRGRDLLDSAPRQIYLQKLLDFRLPKYAHLPLVLGADGAKLSKQNRAKPIDIDKAGETLIKALIFLGFAPPKNIYKEKADAILNWAIEHCAEKRKMCKGFIQ